MSAAIAYAVQIALNTLLPLAPLAPLEGKRVELELQELKLKLAFSAENGEWRVTESVEPPDATISGPILVLMRALNTGSILGVTIRGDAALIQALQTALIGIDLNQLMQQLPRQLPQQVAQQFAEKTDDLRRWMTETGLNLQATAAEYLQQEQFLLPARAQFDAFAGQISAVAEQIEEIQRRVAAIADMLAAPPPADGLSET